MTIEQIKKNAPDDATHYRKKHLGCGYIYYKHVADESLKFWSGGRWKLTHNTVDNHTIKALY